jgi:chemotaxis protein CheX
MTVTLTESSLGEQLVRMVREVWDSFMLGHVEHVAIEDAPPPELVTCANVSLSGEWDAVVMFEVEPAMAAALSGTLLGVDGPDVSEADIADTIGEFANVLGGNLKATVPGTCVMSLPVVSLKTTQPKVKDAVEVQRVAFRWEGQHAWVAVWAPPTG